MSYKKKLRKPLRKTKKLLRKAGRFGDKLNSGVRKYFSKDRSEAKKFKPDFRKVRF
jgi:hypothetical protein